MFSSKGKKNKKKLDFFRWIRLIGFSPRLSRSVLASPVLNCAGGPTLWMYSCHLFIEETSRNEYLQRCRRARQGRQCIRRLHTAAARGTVPPPDTLSVLLNQQTAPTCYYGTFAEGRTAVACDRPLTWDWTTVSGRYRSKAVAVGIQAGCRNSRSEEEEGGWVAQRSALFSGDYR